MIKRIAIEVSLGLIVIGVCAYSWIIHDVHKYGIPSMSERANLPGVAFYNFPQETTTQNATTSPPPEIAK